MSPRNSCIGERPRTDNVSAAGSIYIGEMAPQEIRGKLMSFWQMFYSVGSFIAYCKSMDLFGLLHRMVG